MAIQWGLAGQGFDALQTLQVAGQAAQQAAMQRKTQADEQRLGEQRDVRMRAGGMAAGGDLSGAAKTALQGGDIDFATKIGNLSKEQRSQAAAEARALAAAASRVKTLPLEQRGAALQQMAPALAQHGLTADEIGAADLSDEGIAGYMRTAQTILDLTDPPDEPSIIRTLRAVGLDPQSQEGRDIVTRSLSSPKYLPNGDGTFTIIGAGQGRPSSGPRPGVIEDGYRFNGGDPANPASWTQVGGAGSGPQTFP